MPFEDLPEGQTHYQNDGCGESEHNDWWIKFGSIKDDGWNEEWDITGLISEAQHRERDKWLTKVRNCLAQMPIAGNGRRLLMVLISEMEK